MTGAPVPKGCDCVVMKEDVLKEGRDVLVFKECREGENIRFKGEDIKKDDIVLKTGKKIFPADIGIMASTGTGMVSVFKPPVVAILPTGDELIGINEELVLGKVRDSNSYSLSAQIKETGAFYKSCGIVKDDKELIRNSILSALDECDILLLTGGVSVGDYDYVKEMLDSYRCRICLLARKPETGKTDGFFNLQGQVYLWAARESRICNGVF